MQCCGYQHGVHQQPLHLQEGHGLEQPSSGVPGCSVVSHITDLVDLCSYQILLAVDCRAVTYDTTASPVVKAAAENARGPVKSVATSVLDTIFSGQGIDSVKMTEESVLIVSNMTIPDNRTETRDESLSGSLLKYIDARNASRKDLEEAFCRDIDAFSEAFPIGTSSCYYGCFCKEIGPNPNICAVLYDSGTCSSSGWKLDVFKGIQKRLKYFSSDWKYR